MKSTQKQKEWKHREYLSKREYYIVRDRERYFRFREIVRDAKNRPCADCGNLYHFCVMDFDHRPDEEKIREVSDLKNFSSETKLREEIAKCDVVCANCHRIRTYKRRGIVP